MSNKSIHRDSSYTHKRKSHERQILREVSVTIDKIDSTQNPKRLSRKLQSKMSFEKYVNDIITRSNSQQKTKLMRSRFNMIKANRERIMQQNGDSDISLKGQELLKLQSKVDKLKRRILPQYQHKTCQNQLQEIIYIKNNGDKKCQTIKLTDPVNEIDNQQLTKKQVNIGYNEQQIVNRYWNELENESKISKEAIEKIKQNRMNLLIRSSVDGEEEVKEFNQMKESIFKRLPKREETIHTVHCSANISPMKKKKNGKSTLDTSVSRIDANQEKTSQQKKGYSDALSKQMFENHLIQYLQHKQQKKKFLTKMNKQLIKTQSAKKFYTFVKGGYNLDPSDIDGQYISLQRFNEAKQEFQTLNQLYRNIKNQGGDRIDRSERTTITMDESFNSLIYVNELSNKMSPNQLQKIMKFSKFVK